MEMRHFNGIEYKFTRKSVKNINMRIDKGGNLSISAPRFVPIGEIERFIEKKADWINSARQKRAEQEKLAAEPFLYSKEQCLRELEAIAMQIFPLFADILQGKPPIIKVRLMKTRWGVCHIQKRSITLNMRLLEKPPAAREYVVMHEFVHFLHADHGAGFYKTLSALMPDYKQRRALLK